MSDDDGIRFGDWRALNEFELAVLRQCRRATDASARYFAEQALDSRVQMIKSETGWTLKFEASLSAPEELFGQMVMIGEDLDGEPIQVFMFGHQGVPVEMHFSRIEGGSIREMPHPSAFEVV